MDVISFGSVFLEFVFWPVRQLPRPGEEIFTDEFAISCGGAVTSASAAAQAGARAGLCTLLGDDLGSRVVAEYCAREGVDLSPAARVHRRTAGISVVLNFGGDRAFVTHLPRCPAAEPGEIDRWREVLRRERPSWCYLHAGPAVVGCARLADVFVPNQVELMRLTGQGSLDDAVAAAMPWGARLVVKRGADGALVAGPDGVAEVREGVRQVEVRDLTGAGDAFAGTMIGALLRGASLTGAAAQANAAGSEAASRLGAVGEVEVEGLSVTAAEAREPGR